MCKKTDVRDIILVLQTPEVYSVLVRPLLRTRLPDQPNRFIIKNIHPEIITAAEGTLAQAQNTLPDAQGRDQGIGSLQVNWVNEFDFEKLRSNLW